MKKLMLIPIILFSCSKKEGLAETSNSDTVVSNPASIDNSADQAVVQDTVQDNITIPNEGGRQGMMREVEGNKTIRIADASQIPFSIGEEFTEENQQFILKIKNLSRENISGEITPENPQMNIRFNQIKLADGQYDGPFARSFSYDIKEKGEIWLIIGKSNMASGQATGKFSVSIQ